VRGRLQHDLGCLLAPRCCAASATRRRFTAYRSANLFPWDVVQRVVERVNPHGGIFAVFGNCDVGQASPTVRKVGVVDLQQKTGVDDRLVLLAHRLSDGERERLIVLVIFVCHPMLDRLRRVGRQKRSGNFNPGERRCEIS